jgi:hypothetical protein
MMDAKSRSCSLIIAGERYVGFDCVVETSTRLRAFGFLSGPLKALRLARMLPPVELQFSGEPPRAVTVSQVNDVGVALVVLDPAG